MTQLSLPFLLEDQEGQLWLALARVLSAGELQRFCEDLAVPALTRGEYNSMRFFELKHTPAGIAQLLSAHVIESSDPRRNYTWDEAGQGFFYPEVVLERLTQRAFALLQQRDALPEWLLELCLAIDVGL